ncbi:hypothetical protein GCM10017673_50930 [Streptosporangium violaceochromogenes]|nr:hypothetical protein GCM10017673_50930 [Streptosporangium violaceochromogenes]
MPGEIVKTTVFLGATRLALIATAAMTAALAAGIAPAQAATTASRLSCPDRSVCLFDGGGRRFLTLSEGCWFNNIGAQGYSDRTRAAVNNTAYRVNLANWLAHENRWEHIVTVSPNGGEVTVGDRGLGGVDAVHSIC